MHALLFRQWKGRVKGRDWFDFEWYIRKGVPLNITHFISRALQSGHLKEGELTEEDFRIKLAERIDSLDVIMALRDVSRFVGVSDALKIWSTDYFHQLAGKMTISRV